MKYTGVTVTWRIIQSPPRWRYLPSTNYTKPPLEKSFWFAYTYSEGAKLLNRIEQHVYEFGLEFRRKVLVEHIKNRGVVYFCELEISPSLHPQAHDTLFNLFQTECSLYQGKQTSILWRGLHFNYNETPPNYIIRDYFGEGTNKILPVLSLDECSRLHTLIAKTLKTSVWVQAEYPSWKLKFF